jgi:acyl carrier protein
MSSDRTLDRIREIISDVTRFPLGQIHADSTHETVEGWDSLAQINIIVAVEAEFGAFFTPDEVYELNTVQKILNALQDRAS